MGQSPPFHRADAPSRIQPPGREPRADITISTIEVDGYPVRYSTGGSGPDVLFLHGWGLGHHAYRPGLRRLAQRGVRVFAPALPGFGGTHDLPDSRRSFPGYAQWVRRFVETLGLRDLVVVGHSFGGGVTAQFCLDHRDLARAGILMNSVGAPWRMGRSRVPRAPLARGSRATANEAVAVPMADRPLLSWGTSVPRDVVALVTRAGSVMPSVLEDLVPNVLRNPFGITRIGALARTADLRPELATLRSLGFPLTVVHSMNDAVIPKSSFACLCDVVGTEGVTVPGNHSWPLTEPDAFARVVTDVVRTQRAVHAA